MMIMNTRKTWGLLALLWLALTVTVGLQSWVGDRTIYAQALEARREALHQAILVNKAPYGRTWAEAGALSIQKRVGVVYVAEGVHRLAGLSIGASYKLLDTIFLFATLVGLYFFLRKWLSEVYSLIGMLYFSAVLPLTYFFQLFHPWDRPQLALTIGLLYLIAERRFVLLCLGLALSVVIKFDTVLLPALYLMMHYGAGRRLRLVQETLLLFALAFGVNAWIGHLFPDPAEASRFSLAAVAAQLHRNIGLLLQMNLKHPPLLVLVLPAALAICGFAGKPPNMRAATLFGLALSAVFLLLTNYEEVRAHMVVLVLLLPSALWTLQRWLESDPDQTLPRQRFFDKNQREIRGIGDEP
jgi:hypothetical protein